MRKIIINLIFVWIMILGSQNALASTETYTRTENNLGVSEKIFITPWKRETILNTPKVNSSEKIYDFADLYSEEEEIKLYNSVNNFIIETNMDMAIVTIDENPKDNAMKYADDFYDYNDFGFDGVFSGVLFLIDMDTKEIWMSTTGNAILIYNDERINDILDYVINYKKNSDYKSTDIFIEQCRLYASKGILEGNENYYIDAQGRYRKNLKNIDYVVAIIASAIMGAVITTIIVLKQKDKRKVKDAYNYEKEFKLIRSQDIFLGKKTTKHYIGSSSSSSSGSSSDSSGGSSYSSSRSSTHSSSSGRSHGGGGRKF